MLNKTENSNVQKIKVAQENDYFNTNIAFW